MSAIKLVVIDMDGTLLDDELRISQGNKEAITGIIKKGVQVVLATGRTFRSAQYYAKELKLDIPLITYNGALIKETMTEEVISSKKIPLEEAVSILRRGEENKTYIRLFIDDVLHVEKYDENAKKFSSDHRIEYKIIGRLSENISTAPYMINFRDTPLRIRQMWESLPQRVFDTVSVTSSTPKSLEFMAKDTSKAEALKRLAHRLGVHREEVLAIGNSLNDFEMIEWAGIGVAIKNSDEELLQKWSILSEYDNNHDGVARIIEEYIR